MAWDAEDEKEHQAELARMAAEGDLIDRRFVHELFMHYIEEGLAEIDAGMRALRELDRLDKALSDRRKKRGGK